MKTPANYLLDLVWHFLPIGLRQRLSVFLRLAEKRSQIELPLWETKVYAFTKENERRFSEHLADKGRVSLGKELKDSYPNFSLVLTCLNEEKNIVELLDSILSQQIHPQEVIICDGGSKDATTDLIKAWEKSHSLTGGGGLPFSLHLFSIPGASIAQGRNAASKRASFDLLAFTDAGSNLDRSWSARLLFPFVDNPQTEVSMGYYRAVTKNALERAAAHYIVPQLDALDPRTFIPSGRSLALRKELYFAVGGYPEHLTRSGEDSLFDFYLKTAAKQAAFVPDALAYWQFPCGLSRMFRTVYAYSRGDAEGGVMFWSYYLNLLKRLLCIAADGLLAFLFAFLAIAAFFLLPFLTHAALWCSAFFAFSALARMFLLVMSYSPFSGSEVCLKEKLCRVFSLHILTLAQGTGFIHGLLSRNKTERRRISKADLGHLLLLLPNYFYYAPGDTLSNRILSLLEEGWYLTIVYAQSAKEARYPSFSHPQLEQHLRSEFDFGAWKEKHQPFLSQDGHKLQVIDETNDSLSRLLSKQVLEVQG